MNHFVGLLEVFKNGDYFLFSVLDNGHEFGLLGVDLGHFFVFLGRAMVTLRSACLAYVDKSKGWNSLKAFCRMVEVLYLF